jgi:hypothetical protein
VKEIQTERLYRVLLSGSNKKQGNEGQRLFRVLLKLLRYCNGELATTMYHCIISYNRKVSNVYLKMTLTELLPFCSIPENFAFVSLIFLIHKEFLRLYFSKDSLFIAGVPLLFVPSDSY